MAESGAIPVRKRFPYRRPAELGRPSARRVPVVVVGGGPVGLTAALDLAKRGIETILLNRLDILADGSKAICFSKRSLEIFDRLGIAVRMIEKGVAWDTGKVFWGDRADPIYTFTMSPVRRQKAPGFVNLQQYYVEEFLLDALSELPNVETRWLHEAVAVEQSEDGVLVTVRTPDGDYALHAQYLVACDGAKSSVRAMLGLDFEGQVFEDNFLIADVRFDQPRPAERWFWFNPPFPGDSALLHKQPDGVWRLDFQLGWNIDRAAAVKPQNVAPYVEGMIGKHTPYEFEWISIYTFQCRRMKRFVHDRIIFAGDAAHLVSPFGARGCNSGIADADNLAWKLEAILKGAAPAALLESYNHEATHCADVNIMHSTRSTEFITPKSAASRAFRDAVLELSAGQQFARPFVNSGRLATAVSIADSPLNTPDTDEWSGGPAPGSPAIDAPIGNGRWLLERLGGEFTLAAFNADGAVAGRIRAFCAKGKRSAIEIHHVFVGGHGGLLDDDGLAADRYDARRLAIYLIRPDQIVAGRWRRFDDANLNAALQRALATESPQTFTVGSVFKEIGAAVGAAFGQLRRKAR